MTVLVTLVSFGYRYGQARDTIHNYNLRPLPQPSHGARAHQRTGEHKALRVEWLRDGKVQKRRDELVKELVDLITQEIAKHHDPHSSHGISVLEESLASAVLSGAKAGQVIARERADDADHVDDRTGGDEPLVMRVGIGCHSGKHRSVAMVHHLVREQRAVWDELGWELTSEHRDIARNPGSDEKKKRSPQKGNHLAKWQ